MAMDIDFTEYRLSRELRGHEDDVRGICICGNFGIATSSRDKTVRFWPFDPSDPRNYASSKVFLGHTSFVGPLAWISPNEKLPGGGIVSGGMDTLVIVWDLRTGEAIHKLKGHKMQVTGIVLDDSDIVSSSVDCTLRRWRNGQTVEEWEAHKVAVQAVIKLPSGELVTGSSDATLNLWKGKTHVHTFSGHTDTVRSLAVIPDLGILSASHDGSLRLWTFGGEVLLEMVGHTSIVYSVNSHISGLIVSGSEDSSAKIWKDGVCIQTLDHPGCVWDAKFMENGDIVTACSDRAVRIWTTSKDKVADPHELESFSVQLSLFKSSRKRVGGLKLEELPGLDALKIPGTSDGETKVVREGDNGMAYGWNLREQRWDKIGEVVDGPDGDKAQPILNGVQYDYVFDVDIGDGEPMRKLPYNRSENPYDAADKWLIKENLPLSYRQQVVEFIHQNTGQNNFIPDPNFRDPYTGASAYTPRNPSSIASVSSKPTFKHIPKKGMLVFDIAQFDGILKKISEFSSTLLSDQDKNIFSLTDAEVLRLGTITKVLKDTSHYHSSRFSDDDILLLMKLLKSWPVPMLFPVIDLLRMILLHPDGATRLLNLIDIENDILIGLIRSVTATPALPANLLTSIRALTNLFKISGFHTWLQKHRSEILDAFSSCYSSSNKNVQVSYASLILNYAVLLTESKDQDGQSQVLSAAIGIAEEENLESDSKYRALVAIGSMMLEGGLVSKLALDLDVENIAKLAQASKDTKIVEVGNDILLLVKQS